MKQMNSAKVLFAKLTVGALLLATAAAYAGANTSSPAGTWIWTTPGRNGGPDRTNTLTLKVENSNVTGKISAPGRGGRQTSTDISDAKVTDGTLTFNVVRERNGNSMTNKFSGKIEGDTITGKMEFTRNGDTQSRDWTATRSTAAAAPASSDSK